VTGAADGEEIRTECVMLAVLYFTRVFNVSKNPTTHENVRMSAVIRLDLFKALIHPVDAILAMNHVVSML